MRKPDHVFDRDAEWTGLVSFASDARPGATLGVVSGRRRQGKSYLLQALASSVGGIYFPALEMTEAVSLRLSAARPCRSWEVCFPVMPRCVAGPAWN
jgi:hypothetical protein